MGGRTNLHHQNLTSNFETTGENIVPANSAVAPLNAPRQAVFAGYLGSARAPTVCWQINFILLSCSIQA